MAALVIEFLKIECVDAVKYTTFHSNLKTETIINESDIDDVFESTYTKIISNIQEYLGEGSGWIIDSAVRHTISILKINPLTGSSYVK